MSGSNVTQVFDKERRLKSCRIGSNRRAMARVGGRGGNRMFQRNEFRRGRASARWNRRLALFVALIAVSWSDIARADLIISPGTPVLRRAVPGTIIRLISAVLARATNRRTSR